MPPDWGRRQLDPIAEVVVGTKSGRNHMALSIKNKEAEELAKELASITGQTVTGAVIEALRESLLRARGRRTVPMVKERILRIARHCAALPDLDTRPPDEILGYDERGGFR
jgi:antitoxin VapB